MSSLARTLVPRVYLCLVTITYILTANLMLILLAFYAVDCRIFHLNDFTSNVLAGVNWGWSSVKHLKLLYCEFSLKVLREKAIDRVYLWCSIHVWSDKPQVIPGALSIKVKCICTLDVSLSKYISYADQDQVPAGVPAKTVREEEITQD